MLLLLPLPLEGLMSPFGDQNGLESGRDLISKEGGKMDEMLARNKWAYLAPRGRL